MQGQPPPPPPQPPSQTPPQPPSQPPPQPMYQPPCIEDGGQSPIAAESSGLVFCMNVTHNITQLCIGGVIISALIIPNIIDITDRLSQHIILCTVGYFILMTQAILSFSPFGWANNLRYDDRKNIHLVMQIVGAALAISGSVIQILDNPVNFNSSHGICGIVAMILAVVSLIGGLLNLICPKQLSSKLMKLLHMCVGSITLTVAFIALIFAYDEYYRGMTGDKNANLAIGIAVFALFGTLVIAWIKNIKRIAS